MEWFIYRSDDTAIASAPSRSLTPRAMFRAGSQKEAVDVMREYESYRFPAGRQFGKSAVTKATKREKNSLALERLPDINQLLIDEREAAE